MLKIFLLILNVSVINYMQASEPNHFIAPQIAQAPKLCLIPGAGLNYCQHKVRAIHEIKTMLLQHTNTLNMAVINSVIASIHCARKKQLQLHEKLTIIDYSLPSNKKRLWIFDLQQKTLLFHTYVSHGIKSGVTNTAFFSNQVNSKATSLGVYTAEKAYYGRHGLSLKLHGKERHHNDRAYQRAIVMHGAWYMDERFIKKYGRPGRSWGCPAIPLNFVKPIINTIKGGSLFVVYYPGYKWQTKSNYLRCSNISYIENSAALRFISSKPAKEARGEIYYIDKNNNQRREAHDPVLVMEVLNYEHYFKTQVPLKRMIRRQINKTEYVALNDLELQQLTPSHLKMLGFVVPKIKIVRGHYVGTYFKFVELGEIKSIRLISDPSEASSVYSIAFINHKSLQLRSTKHFIRWLGL